MTHPMYPKIQIPAARVMGIGRQPALPAEILKAGDQVVLDYGKLYKLQKKIVLAPQRVRLNMISQETGEQTHRTVSLTSHVAVSWGTFNKRWTAPTKTGGNIMAKTGKKVKLTGQSIDLRSPINTGVSFSGTVDLTKQGNGTPGVLKSGKKVNLYKY